MRGDSAGQSHRIEVDPRLADQRAELPVRLCARLRAAFLDRQAWLRKTGLLRCRPCAAARRGPGRRQLAQVEPGHRRASRRHDELGGSAALVRNSRMRSFGRELVAAASRYVRTTEIASSDFLDGFCEGQVPRYTGRSLRERRPTPMGRQRQFKAVKGCHWVDRRRTQKLSSVPAGSGHLKSPDSIRSI